MIFFFPMKPSYFKLPNNKIPLWYTYIKVSTCEHHAKLLSSWRLWGICCCPIIEPWNKFIYRSNLFCLQLSVNLIKCHYHINMCLWDSNYYVTPWKPLRACKSCVVRVLFQMLYVLCVIFVEKLHQRSIN